MGLLEDRMRSPRHHGPLPDADAEGTKGNPACGDVLRLQLRIREDRIEEAAFESTGSVYQLATADVLCDCIEGLSLSEATGQGPDCVLRELPDLPDRHRYLAHLAVEALRRALRAHAAGERPGETPSEDLDEEAARAFVLTLMQDRATTTAEVDMMARAEGVQLPGGPARFLARLRKAGVIDGTFDVARKAYSWRAR